MEYVGMLSNTGCDSLNSIRNGILEVDPSYPPPAMVMHVFLQPYR